MEVFRKTCICYSLEGDLVEIQGWKWVEAQGLHACISQLQEHCSWVFQGIVTSITLSTQLVSCLLYHHSDSQTLNSKAY